MKLSTAVRIALVVFLFLAGNIIIYGLFFEKQQIDKTSSFPSRQDLLFSIAYFSFLLLLCVFVISFYREAFSGSGDIVFLAVMAILLCASVTVFASSLKFYNQRYIAVADAQHNAAFELDKLQNTNNYLGSYATYLQSAISSSQNATAILQQRINEQLLHKTNVVQQVVQVIQQPQVQQPVVPETPNIPEDVHEREYEDD